MPVVNPIESAFQALSDQIAFPVDQVRYITLLFLCYPVAWVFRYALHPNHTRVATRHVFSAAIGIAMGTMCFGWEMFILFGFVGVSYAMLWIVPPAFVQWYSMAWALGCIAVAHFYRLVTDFGGYHLDFTGPLMIHVQKVTLVAFALHDGMARKESSLNADQELQKITVRPTLLEYISYTFNFHSFLAGPSITIQEHLQFMDGSNFKTPENPDTSTKATEHNKEPSSLFPVLSKFVTALVTLGLYVYLCTLYDLDTLMKPSHSFLYLLWLVQINCVRLRFRYYFIWYLVDSFSNAAGLGFSGYDKFGNAKWDMVSNMKFWDVELAPNFRSVMNGWNTRTSLWLRRVCYERVKFNPTMATFVLSAWWHGLYPGYYLCFVSGAIFNEAARKIRRLARPHFQSSLPLKWTYDIVTIVVTAIFLGFAGITFHLLWLKECLLFWTRYYYVPLIIGVIVVAFFPSGKGKPPPEDKQDKKMEKIHAQSSTKHEKELKSE